MSDVLPPQPWMLSAFATASSQLHKIEKTVESVPDRSAAVPMNQAQVEFEQNLESQPQEEVYSVGVRLLSEEQKARLAGNRIIRKPDKTTDQEAVNSLSMGNSSYSMKLCTTCANKECSGHFGIIRLATEIITPYLVGSVVAIVQSQCPYCGAFVVPLDFYKLRSDGANRKTLVDAATTYSGPCPACESVRDPTVFGDRIQIRYNDSVAYNMIIYNEPIITERGIKFSKSRSLLPLSYVKRALERVYDYHTNKKKGDPPSVLDMLGYRIDPRDMIMSSVLVIPPVTRATIMVHGSEADILSKVYSKIIKVNQSVSTYPSDVKSYIAITQAVALLYKKSESTVRELQLDYTDPFKSLTSRKLDPSDPNYREQSATQRVTIPAFKPKVLDKNIKSIQAQLAGKEGKYRSSATAWRAANVARFILSPCNDLPRNWIRIPRFCAFNNTVDVDVTESNIKMIKSLRKKSHEYPAGRLYQVWAPGAVAPSNDPKAKILVGGRVTRYVMEGDLCVYTRYPVIYKGSISVAFITFFREEDGYTNCVELPDVNDEKLHGDHDGDTLVLRFISDANATASAAEWMEPSNNFLSVNDGSHLGGLIMDTLAGSIVMSELYDESEALSEEDFSFYLESFAKKGDIPDLIRNLHSRLERIKETYPGEYDSISPWSPRILLSSVLPEGLCKTTDGIKIIDGVLLSNANKHHFGNSTSAVAINIIQQFDAYAASDMIDKATWLCNRWIDYFGLTYGPNDVFNEEYDEIHDQMQEEYQKISDMMFVYMFNSSEAGLDQGDVDQSAMGISSKIHGYFENSTRGKLWQKPESANIMMKTGKLNYVLQSQILGCVGQAKFGNGFIDKVCNEGRRTSTCYPIRPKGSVLPPEEIAFVGGCYARGIKARDYELLAAGAMFASIAQNKDTGRTGDLFNKQSQANGGFMTENGVIVSTDGKVMSLTTNDTGINNVKVGSKLDVESYAEKISYEIEVGLY